MSESYDALVFSTKINACIEQLHQILERNKTDISFLDAAERVPHRYEDKYLLVERLTSLFGSSVWNVLQEMGLNNERLSVLLQWIQEGHDVNLRFERDESCRFVKETTREEESPQLVTKTTTLFNISKYFMKTVTKITEYHYLFSNHFRLIAHKGYILQENDSSSMTLLERHAEQMCIVRTNAFPFPEQSKSHFAVKVTWLLYLLQLQLEEKKHFQINRNAANCYTPRRNKDIDGAMEFMAEFTSWTTKVNHYIQEELVNILLTYDENGAKQSASTFREASLWSTQDIFMPILPVFHQYYAEKSKNLLLMDTSVTIAIDSTYVPSVHIQEEETNLIVQAQQTSLHMKLDEIVSLLSGNVAKLVSSLEVKLVICCRYLEALMTGYRESVDYVEYMLRKQLIAAIGKVMTPWDFGEYMKFHYRKFLPPIFQPTGIFHSKIS
jgi:hypothetical protein